MQIPAKDATATGPTGPTGLWSPIDWTAPPEHGERPALPGGLRAILDHPLLSLIPLHEDQADRLRITDAQTRHWIGWETPADSRSYVRSLIARAGRGEVAAWVAYDNIDSQGCVNRPVGPALDDRPALGLVFVEALDEPFFGAWYELNFWLHTEHWGKGWARHMADAVLGWTASDTDLQRIMLSWTEGNVRSAGVIGKLVQGAQLPQRVQADKNGRRVDVYNHVIERPRPTPRP